MRKAKASDMRHKVKFYEQVNVRGKDGNITQRWRYVFSIWCREVTIFREQLEHIASGSELLRDRLEMECRYTKKITTTQRAMHASKLYRISIVGDTEGKSDRIRFLMEHVEDGGA